MVARSATRRGRRSTSPAASRTRQCLPRGPPAQAASFQSRFGRSARRVGPRLGPPVELPASLRGPSAPRPLHLLPPRLP
jgi:hypothetical protein